MIGKKRYVITTEITDAFKIKKNKRTLA